MKEFVAEEDGWTTDGVRITDDVHLETIRSTIGRRGPLIVEHKFYRGARGPKYVFFDDCDEFIAYLKGEARAGDKFNAWMLCDVCRDDNVVAAGKYPDHQSRVPRGGAY